MKCIAIDDEELALELLEDNISKVPYLELAGSFNNPLEAIKAIQEQKIELIFLDIQMPGLTGLQFIKSLSLRPLFILITAYEKYALEGFDLDVVDYLVKPVAIDRFIKACNKANELQQLKLKAQTSDTAEATYFFINVDYSLLKVVFTDIMFIEGLKDYIKIHLKTPAKPVVARMSMKAMEEQLPSNLFIRTHKSYIVSKQYVTAIKKNIVFIGQTELPIGDLYKDSVTALTGQRFG